jgi:hypothetical protein
MLQFPLLSNNNTVRSKLITLRRPTYVPIRITGVTHFLFVGGRNASTKCCFVAHT